MFMKTEKPIVKGAGLVTYGHPQFKSSSLPLTGLVLS